MNGLVPRLHAWTEPAMMALFYPLATTRVLMKETKMWTCRKSLNS